MIIEDIKKSDIEIISYLHTQNLKSSSSKIGVDYIKKLYILLLTRPDIHICLLAREKGEIIASITASTNLHATSKVLTKLISPTTIFLIIKAILLSQVYIYELIQRWFFEKKVLQIYKQPYPTILTIFVDHNFQRKGLGKKLIKHMLKILKRKGAKTVYVDTLKKNRRAIMFYKSLGFKQINSISDSVVLQIVLS